MSLRQVVSGTTIKRSALRNNELKFMRKKKGQTCRSCLFLQHVCKAINNILTTTRRRAESCLTGRGGWVVNGHHLFSVDK